MATALLIPLFIPFVVAMLCVFTWKRPRLQGRLTVVGMIAMLVFAIRLFDTVRESGIIAVQAGGGRLHSGSHWQPICYPPLWWC